MDNHPQPTGEPAEPRKPAKPHSLPEFTDASPELKEQLKEYARAVRSEFESSTNGNNLSPLENAEAWTKDFFKKSLPEAAAQVVFLAEHSTSDSVRLNASKFIIEEANKDAQRDGDPIRELLQSLTAQPSGQLTK